MVMTRPLGTNIEQLREDFASVTGKPFRHFYCPILHTDEDVPLMGGHVVPESLGGKTRVLQREDVDQGFGSFFEAEAADAVRYGLDADPLDVVGRGDPKEMKQIGRRFDFQLLFEGTDRPLDAVAKKKGDEVAFYVRAEDLKAALGERSGQQNLVGTVAVGLDARSSILVTSLRSNHLGWFRMCGYRYVFSNEGIFVAGVLKSFYQKFIEPRRGPNRTKQGSLISEKVKQEVDEYCHQFANFIRPLHGSELEGLPETMRQGTENTGRFLALWDGDDWYGKISLVKLGNQRVGVMTPVITDERGWALIDVAANLELVFSEGRFDAEAGICRIDPPGHRAIWPSVVEETRRLPPLSIRQAAQLVRDSGRMR